MFLFRVLSLVALAYCQSTVNDICLQQNEDSTSQCELRNMQETMELLAGIIRDQEKRLKYVEKFHIKNCQYLLEYGTTVSGVYEIGFGKWAENKLTYCDMETEGGGWTVFQRRQDGSENFRRSWEDFKQGFGDPSSEFWLGNEYLHILTFHDDYKIRIDLEDWEGERRYAVYSLFRVYSEDEKYKLKLGEYAGTAGDSGEGFSFHNGALFSTFDQDNDDRTPSCISQYGYGEFWLKVCLRAGLNNYYGDSSDGNGGYAGDGIRWDAWRGNRYSLKSTKMMIKPIVY